MGTLTSKDFDNIFITEPSHPKTEKPTTWELAVLAGVTIGAATVGVVVATNATKGTANVKADDASSNPSAVSTFDGYESLSREYFSTAGY